LKNEIESNAFDLYTEENDYTNSEEENMYVTRPQYRKSLNNEIDSNSFDLNDEENDYTNSEEEENDYTNSEEEENMENGYEFQEENYLGNDEENGLRKKARKPFKRASKPFKQARRTVKKPMKKIGKAGKKTIKKVSKAATKYVEAYAKTTKVAVKATAKFVKQNKNLLIQGALTVASAYCPALAPVLQMYQYQEAAKAAKKLYDNRKDIGRNLKKGRIDKAGKIIVSQGSALIGPYANKLGTQLSNWATQNLPVVSKGIEAYKEGKQIVDKYTKIAQDVKKTINQYKEAYDKVVHLKSTIKSELKESILYELDKYELTPAQLLSSYESQGIEFIEDVKSHLSQEAIKALGDSDIVQIAAELSKDVSTTVKESQRFVKAYAEKVSSTFESQVDDLKEIFELDPSDSTLTHINTVLEDIRKQYGASALSIKKSIDEQMKEAIERVAQQYKNLYDDALLSLKNEYEKAENTLKSYQFDIESKIIGSAKSEMISSIIQEIGKADYNRYHKFFSELIKGNYNVQIPKGLDNNGKLAKMIQSLKAKK